MKSRLLLGLCTVIGCASSPNSRPAGPPHGATASAASDSAGGHASATESKGPRILQPDWGERGERPRTYDLKHIRFALDFDLTGRTIAGEITNVVAPFESGLREIEFDSEELTITKATVDGKNAEFTVGPKTVKVALDHSVPPGQDVRVTLTYHGKPRTGLHWVGPEHGYPDKAREVWSQGEDMDNHFWLPTWDYPNDRTSWEAILTVPADLTAVSNGVLVDTKPGPRAGTKTWHYKMEQPNVTYLIAVAIGPWERYADTWRGKPVEYFVPKGTGEAMARRSFGRTPEMLEFFSQKAMGVEYAWPKYAQVAVNEFVVGGMENVSNTLQTALTLHDERAHLDQQSEGLVAHELAHQWFGDLMTCRSWDHLWLNEGFATYFGALWTEHSEGEAAFRAEMARNQDGAREEDDAKDPIALAETYFTRAQDRSFPGRLVYTKGSSVLHMLRFVVGDQVFAKGIQHYVQTNRDRTVDSEDLRRAFADVTGQPLEWFFQEWVYGAGVPEFAVDAAWDAKHNVEVVTVKQQQKVGGLVPYFRMPVDLAIVEGGKKSVHRVWVSQAENRFELPAAHRPQLVRFDEGGWLLKTLKFDKPTKELAWQLEHDETWAGKAEAIAALADKVNDDDATVALARLAGSSAAVSLRTRAEAALGARRTSDRARKALLAALEAKGTGQTGARDAARVRTAAAKALGGFAGNGEVATALENHLGSDDSYATRAASVRALGRVLGKQALDTIAAASTQKSWQDQVAVAAIETMADVDPQRALPRLLAAAEPGQPYALRVRAFDVLGRISPELEGAERAHVYDALDRGMEADYYRARMTALRAMGSLGGTRAQERLERASKEEADPGYRKTAERTAGQVKKGVALKEENDRLKQRVNDLERELRGEVKHPAGARR
jgi:aminopeptidase N